MMASMELSLSDLESLENLLGTPYTLTRMSSGFSNDNYLFTTSLSKYRLRVPQFCNQFDQPLEEQMILKWASEKSTLIVPLLYLITLPNGTHASVFPYIDADPKFDIHNEQLMYSAGKALAEYHFAVAGYSGKLPWKALSESFSLDMVNIEELKTIINDQSVYEYPTFWNAVENLLSRMKKIGRQLNEELYISLPHLSCHGDYATSNLLALQNEIVGIIDFECCRWAPRVHDLSLFLLSLQQGEGYEEFMQSWFLKGYQSMVTLSKIELELIPEFQIIRSLESAKRHFIKVIKGDHQVNAGLVIYWDRITTCWPSSI